MRASRLLVWAGLAAWFRLFHPFFLPRTREPLLCRKEVREFVRLAAPSIASNFSGWLIFELQIIALTNVHGVSTAQVAAAALSRSRPPSYYLLAPSYCLLATTATAHGMHTLAGRWRPARSGCSVSRRSPLRSRAGSR